MARGRAWSIAAKSAVHTAPDGVGELLGRAGARQHDHELDPAMARLRVFDGRGQAARVERFE